MNVSVQEFKDALELKKIRDELQGSIPKDAVPRKVRKDCFGYNSNITYLGIGQCKVLTETICEKRDCPFFKTEEDFVRGQMKYPLRKW